MCHFTIKIFAFRLTSMRAYRPSSPFVSCQHAPLFLSGLSRHTMNEALMQKQVTPYARQGRDRHFLQEPPSYPPFAPANHPQTTYPFTCDMPSCGFFTVIRRQFARQRSDRHPACRRPFFKPEQTCHIQPDVPIGKNAVGRQAIGNGKMTRTPVSTSRNCATKAKAAKDTNPPSTPAGSCR